MVERLDAHGLVQRLVAAHPAEIDAMLEEALDIVAPGTWDAMAPEARDQVRGLVLGQVEQSVGHALAGVGDKAEDLIDRDRRMVGGRERKRRSLNSRHSCD